MTLSYPDIIRMKYPGATDYGTEADFRIEFQLAEVREGTFNEDGTFTPPDNSDNPLVPVITLWNLPDPQPTIAELDAYAASPEFLAAWGAKLKAEAEAEVNKWANQKVMDYHILEPELFYVAMIANIAFRLLEWTQLGKPETVDPLRFMVTHSETQAYSETTVPGMTPANLLRLQEQRWLQMQQGFAGIVYVRRLVLGQIELATVDEGLPAALALLTASLDPLLQEAMQNLAAQAAQLIAQQSEV